MEIKVNQKNAAGESHGYFESGHFKFHFFKGSLIGYAIHNGDHNPYHVHYINYRLELIGCAHFGNSQEFFNKPGKKFGEKIEWK